MPTTGLTRPLSVLMAATALVGGYVHLKLYNDGYKDIPVGHIGAQFLLNAIGAVAIAAGLVLAATRVLPRSIGLLAAASGVLWGAIALIAFFVARTDGGWFGFQDQPGLNPSPEAAFAVSSESATVLLGLALVAIAVRARRSHGTLAG
jgi:hypothetical protein